MIDQDAPLEIYQPVFGRGHGVPEHDRHQGGGIKRQSDARRRFFPMDYDLTQPERVMVTLRGRIVDVRYTRLLMAQGERIGTIMLLDKAKAAD
ncbi:MAG: hypothetical protein R3E55_07090 [Burkholderiaceae bacterium]